MKVILVSAVVGFICTSKAILLDDLRKRFYRDLIQCQVMHYCLDFDELNSLMAGVIPKGKHVPCLIACSLKKNGIIDDKGKFNTERGHDLAQLLYQDCWQPCLRAHVIVDTCSYVNNIKHNTTDVKGCHVAKLLYKCVLAKAHEVIWSKGGYSTHETEHLPK